MQNIYFLYDLYITTQKTLEHDKMENMYDFRVL